MPIEVSPAPFTGQQLPYTPKFVRNEVEDGMASGHSALGRGPASAAASAIIPPSAGGLATPHHAIPALSEAGYTAPTIRPTSIGLSMPPVSGYAHQSARGIPAPMSMGPASIMGDQHLQGMMPGAATHAMQGQGWASSLPAPRQAPSAAFPVFDTASVTQHPHHGHRHRHDLDATSEAGSDASYYAKPKGRHRSGSLHSHTSEVPLVRDVHLPRRTGSLNRHHSPHHHHQHHHHEHQPQPHHSPVLSAVPRELASPQHQHQQPPPPQSVRSSHTHGHAADQNDPRGRTRRVSKLVPEGEYPEARHRRHSIPVMDEVDQRMLAAKQSSPHRRPRSPSMAPPYRSMSHHHDLSPSLRGGDTEHDPGGPRRRGSVHREERRRSVAAYDPDVYEAPSESGRRRHHSHNDHQGDFIAPRPAYSVAHAYAGRPPDDQMQRDRFRRRAVSMQFDTRSEMLEDPRQAAVLAGLGSMHLDDDGASVAGSALTFADGAIDGRVSQYGLPKYAHQAKPDWRRYCVQRGKADVFLD